MLSFIRSKEIYANSQFKIVFFLELMIVLSSHQNLETFMSA